MPGIQARNQRAKGILPPAKFFVTSGKCVGHKFKTIGHSLKNLGHSQKTLRPLVSRAGKGPTGVLTLN